MPIEHNPDYIHHTNPSMASAIREVVFGMEDGLVSTLGSITGIAAATQDPFTTVLAGFVIIGVESISMGVGSYISNKSQRQVDERKLFEEKTELKKFPKEEKQELYEIYLQDGWPKQLAKEMAEAASRDQKLFLNEMAYHELGVVPENMAHPFRNGLAMFVSYVVGGLVPILPYLILPIWTAVPVSIGLTLIGLFILGVVTTKFTKRNWVKAGLEMLLLAGLAAGVGYVIGQVVAGLQI